MKDPIQKYFDVGTIQWMTYPPQTYPVSEALKKIACDDYFGAVEITHIEDMEARRQVREMLRQSHLRVSYGAQPALLGTGLNPNDLDDDKRLEAQNLLMAAVDEAEWDCISVGKMEGGGERTVFSPAFKDLRGGMSVCVRKRHDGGTGGL